MYRFVLIGNQSNYDSTGSPMREGGEGQIYKPMSYSEECTGCLKMEANINFEKQLQCKAEGRSKFTEWGSKLGHNQLSGLEELSFRSHLVVHCSF